MGTSNTPSIKADGFSICDYRCVKAAKQGFSGGIPVEVEFFRRGVVGSFYSCVVYKVFKPVLGSYVKYGAAATPALSIIGIAAKRAARAVLTI